MCFMTPDSLFCNSPYYPGFQVQTSCSGSSIESLHLIIRRRPDPGPNVQPGCFKGLQMRMAPGRAQNKVKDFWRGVWPPDLLGSGSERDLQKWFRSGGQTTAKLGSFLLIYFTGNLKPWFFWITLTLVHIGAQSDLHFYWQFTWFLEMRC